MEKSSALTTEQALDLLNQIRLRIEMKGQDHMLALQAYETLKEFISANTPKRSG